MGIRWCELAAICPGGEKMLPYKFVMWRISAALVTVTLRRRALCRLKRGCPKGKLDRQWPALIEDQCYGYFLPRRQGLFQDRKSTRLNSSHT